MESNTWTCVAGDALITTGALFHSRVYASLTRVSKKLNAPDVGDGGQIISK